MLNKKFKIAFFMLIIGFILIALDVDVRTGFSYPTQYKNTNEVIGEYHSTILHQIMVLNVLINI